jgi:hypothetical protein
VGLRVLCVGFIVNRDLSIMPDPCVKSLPEQEVMRVLAVVLEEPFIGKSMHHRMGNSSHLAH